MYENGSSLSCDLLCFNVRVCFGLLLENKTVEISVRKGDYLIDICNSYLKNPQKWREIAALNEMKNPNLLYPGEKLKIPVAFLAGVPANGTVTFVKGDVNVFEERHRDWKVVRQNDLIAAGILIKTGNDSAVELSYDNGIVIFLRSNTKLNLLISRKIDSFHFLFQYFLDIGKSIISIKKVLGHGSRFTIETPSAIAGARGTAFRLSNDLQKLTRCEVTDGAVLIQAQKREIELVAGEGTIIAEGKSPENPVKLLNSPEPINLLSLYRTMPLELGFSKIEKAAMYGIMLAKDIQFKNIVKSYEIEPGSVLSIIGLSDGLYYLKTASRDALGLEGPWSETHVLKVRVNPLPPFLQFPGDGAEIRSKIYN